MTGTVTTRADADRVSEPARAGVAAVAPAGAGQFRVMTVPPSPARRDRRSRALSYPCARVVS